MDVRKLERQLALCVAQAGGSEDGRREYITLERIADCEWVQYQMATTYLLAAPKLCLANAVHNTLGHAYRHFFVEALGLQPGPEIALYDGLVRGAPYGVLADGEIVEFKTVALERFMPGGDGRVPNRTLWQVQAYLHFLDVRVGHVVYLARDTGCLAAVPVWRARRIGDLIAARVARLVLALETRAAPVCSCGFHRDGQSAQWTELP